MIIFSHLKITNTFSIFKTIFRDPKIYANPEEFKPERFSDDEQRNRHKSTYLTFGDGPRVCIGQRFATLQIKAALAQLVLNFQIKLSPRHQPIVIDTQSLLLYPKSGILLQFEARQ